MSANEGTRRDRIYGARKSAEPEMQQRAEEAEKIARRRYAPCREKKTFCLAQHAESMAAVRKETENEVSMSRGKTSCSLWYERRGVEV